MKDKKKTKLQLAQVIESLQNRIKKLLKTESKLENKEKELREFEETLDDRVDTRTAAERVIKKILHADIEERKQLEQVMGAALEYSEGVIDTIRDPLIVLDVNLRVISANRSFYGTFKVKPEDTEGQHIYDLGDHQWSIPKLRGLLEEILPRDKSFDSFEVTHVFPDIGKRTMRLNARKVYRKANHMQLILLAIEDITEPKP